MVTADAGFVGYEYWKTLIEGGRHFVIRVGASVKLLKQLGYARESSQTVSLWPDKAASRRQPPLTLRLVVVHNGKHPVYLVTDLPQSRLWAACLFGKHHLQSAGNEPVRLSVAKVLKALRTPLREYKPRPDPGEDLGSILE